MTQPSGWYDDPSDPTHLRYFDGVVWTEHRAPKEMPASPAAQDPYAAAAVPAAGTGRDPYAPGADPYATPAGGDPQAPWGAPAPWEQPPGGQPVGQPAGHAQGWGAPALHGLPLAGWWARVGAVLVDGLTFGLLVGLAVSPLVRGYAERVWQFTADVSAGRVPATTTPPRPDGSVLLAGLAMALAWLVYETVCTTRWGRTLGKRVVGLRVVPVEAPGHLGWGRSVVRAAVKHVALLLGNVPFLSELASMVRFLDVLWPLWDKPLRQALHDKAGRSAVVRDR